MKLLLPFLSIVSLSLLASCDKEKRAEIRNYTAEVANDAKKSANELKDSATEFKDKVANSPEYKSGKLKVKGTWSEAKGKLKKKYAELTDDDLLYKEGQEEELYGRLQRKLGMNREEVEKILQDQE